MLLVGLLDGLHGLGAEVREPAICPVLAANLFQEEVAILTRRSNKGAFASTSSFSFLEVPLFSIKFSSVQLGTFVPGEPAELLSRMLEKRFCIHTVAA